MKAPRWVQRSQVWLCTYQEQVSPCMIARTWETGVPSETKRKCVQMSVRLERRRFEKGVREAGVAYG